MASNIFNEYIELLKLYEAFNDQFLIIKGWAATVGIAALLAAYTSPVTKYGRIGVIMAAVSAVPFWVIEVFQRVFQDAHLERLKALEKCARNAKISCVPMQAVASWKENYGNKCFGEKLGIWLEACWPLHVSLPYLFLFLLGIALAVFVPPKPPAPNSA